MRNHRKFLCSLSMALIACFLFVLRPPAARAQKRVSDKDMERMMKNLVNECLQVSPATHPPCNAQNSCALIISEIRRSCSMLGQGAPGFCADYR
jgi:hypothetical protein